LPFFNEEKVEVVETPVGENAPAADAAVEKTPTETPAAEASTPVEG
jgi:hypothetical protein